MAACGRRVDHFDPAKLFENVKDVRQLIKVIRIGLASILGYEDACLLIKDDDQKAAGQYFALSPNVVSDQLSKYDKIDLFFYNPPARSISMRILQAGGDPFVAALPRNVADFYEGIDNLTPIGHLRESVYVSLYSSGLPVGVLQLINKRKGQVTPKDVELAKDVGDLLGNYLSVMSANLRLMNTIDRLSAGVLQAMNGDL